MADLRGNLGPAGSSVDLNQLESWGQTITSRVNLLELANNQLRQRVKSLEDRLSAYEEAHVDKLMEKNGRS